MLKRFASVGFFWLLATCGGACQDGSQSLPDAPSAQAVTGSSVSNRFEVGPRSFDLTSGATGGADVWRRSAFVSPDKGRSNPERSDLFLGKYLNPSVPRRGSIDHPSESGTTIGRATNAAARIFFTRDESGRDRVNTSYFLRALTTVAASTASRPYWRRSATEPISAFGSTVGNDAGMNLLHEFQPGIQHLVISHAPKFVVKMIGERIGQH
jgi:hypothetical protein